MTFSKRLLLFASVIVAICAILAFGNPHSLSWPMKCPLYQLTGLQCPFCGTQRAIHELLNGNIIEAWHLNPGFFLILPYLCLLTVGQIKPSLQKQNCIIRFCYNNRTIFLVLAATIVWGIVRNV